MSQPKNKDGFSGMSLRNGGKGKGDKVQTTLDDKVKRVSFENADKSEVLILKGKVKKLQEEVADINKEKAQLEKVRKEIEDREKKANLRLEMLENNIKMIELDVRKNEDRIKQVETALNELSTTLREEGTLGLEAGGSEGGSVYSSASRRTTYTNASTAGFSEIEERKIKRILYAREREEKRNNVVIKGLNRRSNVSEKELVLGLFRKDLKLDRVGERDIVDVWKVAGLTIVKLCSFELKSEIMKKKNTLKGTNIFIENDLTFEDRKKQESIFSWIKARRVEGFSMRIGFNKVFYKNVWYKWEEKEKLETLLEKEKNTKSSLNKNVFKNADPEMRQKGGEQRDNESIRSDERRHLFG